MGTPHLTRKSSTVNNRDNWVPQCGEGITLTIVVAGASGDLARKKTYPSLQFLFCNNFLPKKTRIIGYARSPMSDDDLRKRLRPTLSGKDGDVEAFLSICTYMHGPYDTPEGYQALEKAMEAWENDHSGCNKQIGRLYYLALPPTVYPVVCRGLKENCDSIAGYEDSDGKESWIRVIVEKPFGRDVDSSEELAEQLAELYPEEQLYRIDHYLGKEMLQSLFVMRFANTLLAPVWDRASVASVQITFKEDFGTQGRGGYFDHYGIIRDMIATHLSQILAFVGMEKPMSQHPEDIRDEKLKLLRCLRAVKADDVVIGQYLAGEDEPGYLDDPTVPEGSKTPTYAAMVLYIDNDRWSGVPFIIRAGKALNERKAEIRLQLHRPAHFIFEGDAESMRNEVVIRLQPDEAIYCKVMVKTPGLEMDTQISELELDYRHRYPGVVIPDAYSRLILEALRGDQQHFLRRDELRAAWAVFTPLLHEIDAGKVPLHNYEFGSRGPSEADDLMARVGYKRPAYNWRSRSTRLPDGEELKQGELAKPHGARL